MVRIPIFTGCFLAILFVPGLAKAQVAADSQIPDGARAFVQDFYSWYLPIALRDNSVPASDIALKSRPSVFSRQLAELLRADFAAQAKCEDIIGLDWDPFLSGQDPAEQYELGRISRKGRYYSAELYSARSGKRSEEPDVRAEFSKDNGHWFFVNVYYHEGADLLKTLRFPKLKCSAPRPASGK